MKCKKIKAPKGELKKICEELGMRGKMELGPIIDVVNGVLDNIKKNGDKAVFEYTKKFDKADIDASNVRVTDQEIADAINASTALGYPGGMLVVNPIPEEYSMDADVINRAIDDAIAEANEKGVKGKETTPFLLAKIKDITKGSSLAANIQLVYNNVRLAAKIAASL